MKKIEINFADFWTGFDKEDNFFVKMLAERYDVVISPNPEYLFFSCYSKNHLKHDCVKIFYTAECLTPNFNLCDYAFGFDYLDYMDRYYRLPLFVLYDTYNEYESYNLRSYNGEKEPRNFCNFIYSNSRTNTKRDEFFNALNKYKKVDSGGRHLNNIGYIVKDKKRFQKNYKFSIAFENTLYPGYTTEKIFEALTANTIPIYYGNPLISKDFNPDCFINCHDYNSFADVIEKVKKVDNDEALYKSYVSAPIKTKNQWWEEKKFKEFLWSIFDQDVNNARRRPLNYRVKGEEFDANISAVFNSARKAYLKFYKWDK